LRDEFREHRAGIRRRDGKLKRVFVFFGGSDMPDLTSRALNALEMLNRHDIAIDVVVGGGNVHRDRIRKWCVDRTNINFHCNTSDMARLMSSADLAIGAGGSTTWERCSVGLGSLVVSLADNQTPIAREAAKAGACRFLGEHTEVSDISLAEEIAQLANDPESLVMLGVRAAELVDGLGAARVVDAMTCPDGSGDGGYG
jgi:UDP-2,4-diacetamido-2,4,6-trideoxy-beta-L-altropyranose hydrolase